MAARVEKGKGGEQRFTRLDVVVVVVGAALKDVTLRDGRPMEVMELSVETDAEELLARGEGDGTVRWGMEEAKATTLEQFIM